MSNVPPPPTAARADSPSGLIGRFSLDALASALGSAGLGLLLWMGINLSLLQVRSDVLANLRNLQYTGLVLGGLLAALSVINLRACPTAAGVTWRQRTAAALVLTLACTVATVLLLMLPTPRPAWTAVSAGLLSLTALGTVLGLGLCRSEDARPQWRWHMVAPSFLAYALLAGASVLFSLIALKWPGQRFPFAPASSLLTLALIAAAAKAVYWMDNGGLLTPVEGVPAPRALALRAAILVLLAVVPALLVGALVWWPGPAPRAGWWLLALAVLVGGYLERQLLTTEAGTQGLGGASTLAPDHHKYE